MEVAAWGDVNAAKQTLLGPLPDDSFAILICLESNTRNDFEIIKTSSIMRYVTCFQSACSFPFVSSLIFSPDFIEIMPIVCVVLLSISGAATPVYAAFSRRCFAPDHMNSSVIVWMTFDFPVLPFPWISMCSGGGSLSARVCCKCQVTISYH